MRKWVKSLNIYFYKTLSTVELSWLLLLLLLLNNTKIFTFFRINDSLGNVVLVKNEDELLNGFIIITGDANNLSSLTKVSRSYILSVDTDDDCTIWSTDDDNDDDDFTTDALVVDKIGKLLKDLGEVAFGL